MIRKKRCTFMIEPDVLERLHSITARTGLSQSEQIRQGIRWWLESREWPIKGRQPEELPSSKEPGAHGQAAQRRRRTRRHERT